MNNPRQGLTLTEILIASALAVVVIAGIGILDVTRTRMQLELEERSGMGSEEPQVALAAIRLGRSAELADRLVILETGIPGVQPTAAGAEGHGKVQLRYVDDGCQTTACLDDATSYHWDEYRWNGQTVEYFRDTQNAANCGTPVQRTRQVAAMTFRFKDEAPVPPGGDPFAPDLSDNDVLEFALRWDNTLSGADHKDHEFRGEAMTRAAPYSNVNAGKTGPGDSGTGLAPDEPAFTPPAPCP